MNSVVFKENLACDASNRRAHPRIACAELVVPAQIRIPNRPPVTLVDLSVGGALLELPFQLQPASRVTLELSTSAEQLAVPFQLLRCYVVKLKGGVRYHAAGAFHQSLKLPATLLGVPAAPDRLIATLEGFLLSSQRTQLASSEPRFNDLLCSVVGLLRSGEPRNLISAHIKADIARIFPSLSISRASLSLIRDVSTTARFFDLEFKSTLTLSASDRRFLRASAQLIALIDKAAERQAVEATRSVNFVQEAASSPIVHTLADWQALSMSRRGHPDAMQNHRR